MSDSEGTDHGDSNDAGGSDEGSATGDGGSSRITSAVEWVFLHGDRLLVAALVLVVVLVAVAAVEGATGFSEAGVSALVQLFGTITVGNFTLLSIVISIGQLVISRQLRTPRTLNREIEGAEEYRRDVEETIGVDVLPVIPAEFLEALLDSTDESLDSLRQTCEAVRDDEAAAELADVLGNVQGPVERIDSEMERAEPGAFSALAAALDTNFSRQIYQLRKVANRHGEAYPEEVVDGIDELVYRLQQIDVARQYLETIYIQEELSALSRQLLYVGIPAVVVGALFLRVFAAPAGSPLSPAAVVPFVPLGIAVGLAPLAVLTSYVLRLSTVARRTLAITPFTTLTQERN